MRDEVKVFAVLREEAEIAKRAHNEAKENFWEKVDGKWPELLSGIPSPEGRELIRVACVRENFALDAYAEAVSRLTGYLLHGTIPDDLRERLRKPKAAGSG